MNYFKYDICIVGGAGHVGFPLGLMFASKNSKVVLLDKNKEVLKKISLNQIPFREKNAKNYLKKYKKNLYLISDINIIKKCKNIIVCIGTPAKKNNSSELKKFYNFFVQVKKILTSEQQIIIRSSVSVGAIKKISHILKSTNITYCPERIVQGLSLVELPRLPQIVSGYEDKSIKKVGKLFKKICKKIIVTSIEEAELIKLFSNAYRYIHFSISNQFYMICEKLNLDFKKIRKFMTDGYSRSSHIPTAGFAAGPCLVKDTIQLSNYLNKNFSLGNTALKINQNIPNFIYNNLKNNFNLKKKTIGVLGLSFKADTDDIRDSLSLKFIQILKKNKIKYFQSDEYYYAKDNITYKKLVKKSDIIVIGVQHKKYKKIKFSKNKIIINLW